jgi:hypothetical protein
LIYVLSHAHRVPSLLFKSCSLYYFRRISFLL